MKNRRVFVFVSLMLVLLSSANPLFAQPSEADHVRDHYPKNPGIDVLNYTFELQLSNDSQTIDGTATIDARYVKAGQTALRLDLVKKSDALEGKGMSVDWVRMEGRDLAFRHEDDQLFIELGREIDANEIIQVKLHYSGIPASGLVIGPNKHGDHSFFSDNWSSRARNWLPTVDHPYDKATSEFIVTAPAHLQVVSNGLLVEQTDLDGGNRRTHWKNSVPIATWLFALAAAEFAVQYVDTFDGKSIQTWVYRQDRDAGFYDFAIPTKQTLAFFSDLVGPYSYEKLANIQSNSVGGGMEAASAIFYGDRSVTGNRDRRWQRVIIHEIAHQWFGNAVTEYEWNDVWLSEGFATYYTLLFREYAYGRDDFLEGLKDARDRVFDYYETDYDFRVIRDHLEDLNRVSGPMIYQKGAWTLHMLREMMGKESYNHGVRTYYAEFKDGNAITPDFRRHLEEASGLDLGQFFKQWLYQGGVPSLEGAWTLKNGELVIEIEQTQEKYDFDLSVEFEIRFADGSSERISLEVNADHAARVTRSIDQEVLDVVVDPDTRVLARWTFGRGEDG